MRPRGRFVHALRAYPTLFRVGLAGVFAYRAEFIVWILTTTMPFVMMSLWTAVAADKPVGRFGARDFVAYYLATFIVRLVTSSWLVWELTMEIRQGTLAARLLRPLHPIIAYSAEHLAVVPMRVAVVSPLAVVLAVVASGHMPFHDPLRLAVFLVSLAGAWLILFCTMLMIGALALFVESALSAFELWLGVHFLLSGYLVPLELLPPMVGRIARALPFRYSLAFPVETLIGLVDGRTALVQLGFQWVWVAVFAAGAGLVWRLGMRRFVAFGG